MAKILGKTHNPKFLGADIHSVSSSVDIMDTEGVIGEQAYALRPWPI